MKKALIGFMICMGIAAAAALSSPAFAAVTGACSGCHTMHNSQDGTTPLGGSATPQGHLTLSSCIGCHSGTGVGDAPLVDGTYNTDSCAGGTFNPSGTAADTMIHNVAFNALTGLDTDTAFSGGLAPGASTGLNLGSGSTDADNLVCAGANGCHGDTTAGKDNDAGIQGFHHGTKPGWRFLQAASDHDAIDGIGASDYEVAMSDGWTSGDPHNVYKSGDNGINTLCANCHPNFHGTGNTQASGNWIRHPTDNAITALADSNNIVEDYRDHPFAFDTPAAGDYTIATAGANVACVSCHRAHGSDYPDILRWDYALQSAGSTTVSYGCLGCHTAQQGP